MREVPVLIPVGVVKVPVQRLALMERDGRWVWVGWTGVEKQMVWQPGYALVRT